MKKIYLDNAATTKVSGEVVAEMNRYHLEDYGNPNSLHALGEKASAGIEGARKIMAKELGCKSGEIVFTSGSTESNNLAFFGLARSKLGWKRKKIIISIIEHSSIYSICDRLRKEGLEIVEIGVDREGKLDLGKLEREIDDKTLLVSVIHVQNEIGIVQDLKKIGKLCKSKGVVLHSDAAQGFGKLKIDVNSWGVDILTAGAQKIGGPKGVGLLYVKEGLKLKPLIYGGGQEHGLRSGTENVAGIVGFGKALEMGKGIDWVGIRRVRDYFVKGLERLGGKINGLGGERIWGIVNVSFLGVDGERLILHLSDFGIFCSTGSACESKRRNDDRVLKALGLGRKEINGSLRFSLGPEISKRDVDFVLEELGRYFEKVNRKF